MHIKNSSEKMVRLNFRPSEDETLTPIDHIESDMTIDIPEQGELNPLPETLIRDFPPWEQLPQQAWCCHFTPEKSGVDIEVVPFNLRCDSPDVERRILIAWVKQRGEWVAIFYHKRVEPGARYHESYEGPFIINDYCGRRILDVYFHQGRYECWGTEQFYDIITGKSLLKEVSRLSPDELRQRFPHPYQGYMRGSSMPSDSD